MLRHLLLALAILQFSTIAAQVTVGSGKVPEPYSVLEIDSKSGGLRYPQMNETTQNLLPLANAEAYGLMVFNTSEGSLEYLSEDAGWINMALDNPVVTVPLATIQSQGNTTNGGIITYNFTINFPSLDAIKDLRVGALLDINNVVSTVEGAISGAITNSAPNMAVKIDAIRLPDNNEERLSAVIIYVVYNEKGIDRRVEFPVTLPPL